MQNTAGTASPTFFADALYKSKKERDYRAPKIEPPFFAWLFLFRLYARGKIISGWKGRKYVA
jgi:hypothetical protein